MRISSQPALSAPLSAPLSALVLAGGTGGHVYPALAVAEKLRDRGWDVQWLGSRTGMESTVVPKAGIELHLVPVRGLRGKALGQRLLGPWMVLTALAQSLRVVARLRPSLVLGMGGFVAGPAGLAAWLLRRPLLIHEQNSVPGLTNRLLAPLARIVMEAFPGSFAGRRRVRHTGNPVREAIARLPNRRRGDFAPGRGLHLLVLGGSQGAEALNAVVPDALALVRERLGAESISVRHQSGPHRVEPTRARYGDQPAVEVTAFIDDMAGAYAQADLVVCRAGAMTVAELGAAGVGSILVPFPHAVDDHQSKNARYLADHGAALMLAQDRLTPEALAECLAGLIADPETLGRMATAARARGIPDATDRVVACCLEVAHA